MLYSNNEVHASRELQRPRCNRERHESTWLTTSHLAPALLRSDVATDFRKGTHRSNTAPYKHTNTYLSPGGEGTPMNDCSPCCSSRTRLYFCCRAPETYSTHVLRTRRGSYLLVRLLGGVPRLSGCMQAAGQLPQTQESLCCSLSTHNRKDEDFRLACKGAARAVYYMT